ncbi:MAG: PKD domain-containing protein [Proteiniphilum sp.]
MQVLLNIRDSAASWRIALFLLFIVLGTTSCTKEGSGDEGENPSGGVSPYITRVFEYRPAPGQFINELPKYATGDTPETMAKKAEAAIAGNKGGLISLGGFGGYVVVGFDHTIKNVEGKTDFTVLGNAYAGNSEPGIVMVSVDNNKNGIPDDTWLELAGNEYNNSETLHDYEITYYPPDENKTPVPHETLPYVTDKTYIRWTTNGHGDGYLYKTNFHAQSYWPRWVNENELQFSGSRLPENQTIESGIYTLYPYDWGYADNMPNNHAAAQFDIDWAVDENGKKVPLPGIDFIKIYTAVHQFNGSIGESSTEVSGIIDLNVAHEQ